MKKGPLVTIVTPSLNQGRFIEQTILSVKNQTYPNIEHIVVDGGSTDETLDILRKYSDSLIWISEPDEGQSDAINKGWRMAKGEILGWLNSDDTYMPWAVQTAINFLSENPGIGMVYGGCNIIDERGKVTGQCVATEFDLAEMLCNRGGVAQPAAFLRRALLDEVGYLDTNLHLAMDFDLWIRIGLRFKVKYIPQLLANFRMCPGTKSVDQAYKSGHDHLYILNKLFSAPELPEEVRALKRRAYSYTYSRIGAGYYSQRQMKQARRYLIKSVILYPQQLKRPLMIAILITSFLGRRATEMAVGWKSKFIGKPSSSYNIDNPTC